MQYCVILHGMGIGNTVVGRNTKYRYCQLTASVCCSQSHEGSVKKKSWSDAKEDEHLKDFVLSRYICAQ